MTATLLAHEPEVRLAFFSVLIAVALWEAASPCRPPSVSRQRRWPSNLRIAARFHPIEILLSMALRLGLVAALRAPALAVLIFQVVLSATSMFNHGNIRLPAAVERWFRLLVITPDMNRVHHSVVPRETNSNLGLSLPWWDRLFGTYRAVPDGGHLGMTIGIGQFRPLRDLQLGRMLLQPLLSPAIDYPIGSRQGPT